MSLLLWAQSVMKAKQAVAPAGNEQVIQLPASSYREYNNPVKDIDWRPVQRPEIMQALRKNPDDATYLWILAVLSDRSSGTSGIVELKFYQHAAPHSDADLRRDLSDKFETQGQVVIESGGSALTLNMADFSDDSDPYILESNGIAADVRAFVNAVSSRAGNQAATLTLRDYVKAAPVPTGDSYSIAMAIDRTWGAGAAATPGAGGGNVSPKTFTHDGENWELWQVVPFLGSAVGGSTLGDCRIQLRNRDQNRGSMQLADMPDRIVLSAEPGQSADWTGLPWTFNRPTANSKFSNVGSGNSARKGIDYEPVHAIGASPTAVGIAQGETFTITLHWD